MNTVAVQSLLAETKWVCAEENDRDGYDRDVLVRYIPGIMRVDISDCIAYLNTVTSYTDPKTTPEGTWAGTWTRGRIWYRPARDSEPGKAREGTFNLFVALYKGGMSQSGITTGHGCRYHITQTWYFKYPTLETVPESSSGIEYSMTTPILDDEFGVWTYAIEKKERIYQHVAEYTSERDAFEYQQKEEHVGVRDGDVDENGSAIILPSLATQTAGEIVDLNRDKNEDCTQNIGVKTRTAVNVPLALRTKEIKATETVTTDTDKNDTTAETLPSVQTAGQIKTVVTKENEFKKYDNEVTTRTATELTEAVQTKEIKLSETVTSTMDRNEVDAETLPSVQTAGEIKTVVVKKNDFARYDNEVTTRTSAVVTDAVASKTVQKFETITDDVDKNEAAADTPPTQADGTIVTIKSEHNEFGKFDNAVQTRTAVAQSNAETSKEIRLSETITSATDRNQVSATALPSSQTAGTIVKVTPKLNEFGRYDNETVTRTAAAIADASVSKTVSEYETVDEDTDRNQAAAGTPPTQTAGEIKTVESNKNEFNKFDVTTHTRTAEAITNAEQSKVYEGDETTARAVNRNQVNQATLPTVLVTGTITEVNDRINDFERHDQTTLTKTAVYQSEAISWADRYGTTYLWWGHNATSIQYDAAISAAALDNTTNNSIHKTRNKYDLIDYVILKQPYIAGGGSSGETAVTTGKTLVNEYGQVWNSTENRTVRAYRVVKTTWTCQWYASYGQAKNALDGNDGSHVVQSKGLYGAEIHTVTRGSNATSYNDNKWTPDELY